MVIFHISGGGHPVWFEKKKHSVSSDPIALRIQRSHSATVSRYRRGLTQFGTFCRYGSILLPLQSDVFVGYVNPNISSLDGSVTSLVGELPLLLQFDSFLKLLNHIHC